MNLEEEDEVQGLEVEELAEESSIEELPDGGVLVEIEKKSTRGSSEFDANLAEDLETGERYRIAHKLLELLEKDQESRKKRDEQYEEGLRRSGLDKDASVGANFSGASKAVHPVLIKAAVEFAALAIKELMPPNGPVRTEIIGEQTKEKLAKAERSRDYLNWQMRKKIVEYRSEMEQLLTQLSLGGGQFTKTYWCGEEQRIKHEFVSSDKVVLPFSASSFLSARRKAQILDLTREEVEDRIESGMYRDMDFSDPGLLPEASKTEEVARKIEGKEETGYNEDGTRRIFECYVRYKLPGDDVRKPYIISIDQDACDIWSIYRNWAEDDEEFHEEDWIVEWPFIPFRGALSVGLIHLIGGLSVAATGALNGLLDSAHVNNIPTAVTLKGSRVSGETVELEPTTVQALEGPVGVDDIRKLIMPMPYNPPSLVLFQLLGWLTEQAESVVTTASEKLSDATNNGPVGTTYALIEQGAKVFSSIHARLHFAQERVLGIIRRLNAKHLSDRETVEELGELVVSRRDFEGPADVVPVSDPNIFSETQRWAQLQSAFQLTQDPRVQYNVKALHKRALELLKFPQIDEILPDDPAPQQTNPIAENVNASRGLPLMAFPHEDHMAHLKVHLAFVTDPALGLISQSAAMPMMEHVKQHLLLLYAMLAQRVASSALGEDITAHMVDSKSLNDVDRLLAEAVPHVHELYKMAVAPIMNMVMTLMQQITQAMQAQQQVAPLDPQAQVAREVGMAEIARKAQRDQAVGQVEQAELQLEAQKGQAETEQKMAEMQVTMQEMAREHQLALQDLEQKRVRDAEKIRKEVEASLLKNRDDNRTKYEIEELRQQIRLILEREKGVLNGSKIDEDRG